MRSFGIIVYSDGSQAAIIERPSYRGWIRTIVHLSSPRKLKILFIVR